MNVHYSIATGEIKSWGSAEHDHGSQSHFAGHLIAVVPDQIIHPSTHRIDIETIGLVEKSQDEIRASSALKLTDVAAVVFSELVMTDQFMSPPPDRPRKNGFELDWTPYRQALRDLSKLPSPAEMVKAWPARPDGFDAAAALRARCSD